MYKINPRLTGFSCLRTGQFLGVEDYFEGSPSSASEGYPASLRATYADQGAWPVTSGEKGMARYGHFLPYLTFPSLGEGGTPLIELPAGSGPYLTVSPDRRSLLFSQIDRRTSDIYQVTLPALAGG